MSKNVMIIIGAFVLVLAVGLFALAKKHNAPSGPGNAGAGKQIAQSVPPGEEGGQGSWQPRTGPGILTPTPGASAHPGVTPGQPPAAQPGQPGGRGGRGNGMGGMTLTPEQQQRMQAIRESLRAKRQAIHANTNLSEAEKRAQLQALHIESQQQQRAVLTPEQQQQFDRMLTQRGAPGGAGGPDGRRGGMNDPRLAGLNLSDEQRGKIKAVHDDARGKMQPIFMDTTLSQEERMNRMRQIRQDEQNNIKAILTPAQLQQYQANIQQWQQHRGNLHPGGMPRTAPPGGAGPGATW